MAKRILVIGSTGLLGAPVAHRLNDDGFIVRVVSRNMSKAKKLFSNDFEIRTGNATDKIFLEDSLKDCYGVHISVSGKDDRPTVENVASLARQMGIKHITYVSGSTVNEENTWFPMIKDKLEAELKILKCGVPFTMFRPTWPMEQLPRFVQKGKVKIIGRQPAKIHWFAVNDFASMVSKAYKEKDAQKRKFFIHGPEGYTMSEALKIYCETMHPEIKHISSLPIWAAKGMKLLIRNDTFKMIVDMMAYFDKVGEAGDPTEADKLLGAPSTTLRMWMKPKVEKKQVRVGK